MKPITVVAYDPRWPEVFESLRAPIARMLARMDCLIEHVGSTAVPGLAAKPIIDLDVIVPRPDDLPVAIERLTALGYHHRGDLGIAGREAMDAPHGLPAHHLYVCVRGNLALTNHLCVRDHLRAHPAVAEQYGTLKRELAATYRQDMDAYVEGKSAFLRAILKEAGLAVEELDSIAAANRPPER